MSKHLFGNKFGLILYIFVTCELLNFVTSQQNQPSFTSLRTRRPRAFSFFREFIDPLPGVLNDMFTYPTRNDPIVETSNGALRGTTKESRDGRKYYAFLGVPYAKPPVGPLRFEPPQKLTERWRGVRPATQYASPCFHMDAMVSGRLQGQEDCLYANIYTPKLRGNLPVMVYIHGGGFFSGSGDFYQGKYFMDYDTVVVIFNYRLAALGFLNTEDENIRGNMGLKDQNLLLQFVRDNIQSFGGDKDSITLFGESAGAAMTQYHMLSKQSNGLFQKAISLSGSAICPWAFQKRPKESAIRLAEAVGCPSNDTKLMVRCLKLVPVREFAKEYKGLGDIDANPADYYAPSIERVIREDTFLSESPEEILKSGNHAKIPLMMGTNSMEGLLFTSRILADKEAKALGNKYFDEWIPKFLSYRNNTRLTSLLKALYFTTPTIDLSQSEDFLNLTNLLSDATFVYPTHKFAQLYEKNTNAPVYIYYNTYQGRISVFDVLSKIKTSSQTDVSNVDSTLRELNLGTELINELINYRLTNQKPSALGASHGDPVFLLFNMRNLPGIGHLSMDYEMSKSLVRTLVEFASSRNPEYAFYNDILWPRVETGEPMKYMSIELPGEVINEPFSKLKIWDKISVLFK